MPLETRRKPIARSADRGLSTRRFPTAKGAALLLALLGWPGPGLAQPPQAGPSRIEAAIANITALDRTDEMGLATAWDGDNYVQCRRTAERALRCEAAGTRMQPSLGHVLTPERVKRLGELGWRLDPSFGNYAQTFPATLSAAEAAGKIGQALAEGYDADLAQLEVQSDWVRNEPCPPRNGPTQNLAGMINDAPAMRSSAVHACAYAPETTAEPELVPRTAAQLFDLYGARVTGEIQRLRVNLPRDVYVSLDTQIGFVQCAAEAARGALYCEAQSIDSWPALASVLTPERVAQLHAAGFADPGRGPNYGKFYALDRFDDASIARELLTILHDVYGYQGSPKLKVTTEKRDD